MKELLHHYTSIESLALILETRKLRFTRLDLLDDQIESKYYGKYDLSNYIYVSCWTGNLDESIPQWQLYTPKMRGVRITFASRMFPMKNLFPSMPHDPRFDFLFTLDELVAEDYCIMPTYSRGYDNDFFVKDVEYLETENEILEKLGQVTKENSNGGIQIDSIRLFAKYKTKEWSFQNETRFVLCILPIHPGVVLEGKSPEERLEDALSACSSVIINQIPPKLTHFDMKLADSIVNNIQVTLGPKCSRAEEIIVKSLLKTYTSRGSSRISRLHGKIK